MLRINQNRWLLAVVLGAVFVLANGQESRAGFIAMESASLADLDAGGSLHAGATHFTNFMINNTVASGGPIPFDPDRIRVVAGLSNGAPALNFLLAAGVGPGQLLDLDFKFDVHASGDIVRVESLLNGAAANIGGVVSLAETIFHANNFPGPPLGSVPTSNVQIFNATRLRPPASWITVSKDLFLSGGEQGTASISSFFQTFQVVPEPSSMVLGMLSLLGLIHRTRRQR